MGNMYLLQTINLLADKKDDHANIIAYSIVLGIFAILTIVFGYLYFLICSIASCMAYYFKPLEQLSRRTDCNGHTNILALFSTCSLSFYFSSSNHPR